jgi:5'-deoxynucleotidase YfbR-like HD superfamily hydrolase
MATELDHDMNPTGRGFRIPMPISRKFVYPQDPRPEDFDMRDIAHKLSMICRYAGGTIDFYSVAEHCCHLHDWFMVQVGSREYAKSALLHDRAEAWMGDQIRPFKRLCQPWWNEMETRIDAVSAPVFGVPDPMPDEVAQADYRICIDEKSQAYPFDFDKANTIEREMEPMGIKLLFWYPHIAYEEFMTRWRMHN